MSRNDFSEKRALADVRAIWEFTRWCTTPKILAAAEFIAARLKEQSRLLDVELILFPADGKTFHGGWVMPKAWDVTNARLTLREPCATQTVLADYHENPLSLMLLSPPTPCGGIEAEVAHVRKPFEHNGSLAGRFALVDNFPQVSVSITEWLARRGAVGVISDHVIKSA
jgi:hypothetical protein